MLPDTTPTLLYLDRAIKKKSRIMNIRARTRWFLLYTLYNNPSVRLHRTSHIHYMNMMKERLARRYNMNKSALGNLVKNMNNVFASKGDINDDSVGDTHGINAAQGNWNALLGINHFLRQIQLDMARNQGIYDGDSDRRMNIVGRQNAGFVSDDETVELGNKADNKDTEVFVNAHSTMWKKVAIASRSHTDTPEHETRM